MKTSIQKTDELGRVLSVTLPIDKLNEQITEALNGLTKTIRIDGFRKGKVPMQVLRSRYGESVKQEQANKLVSDTLPEAFVKENISPVAAPKLMDIRYEQESMMYEVAFDVYPEVVLKALTTLTINKVNASLEQTDIDEALNKMRENFAQYQEKSAAAVEGDRLTIDFVGYLNGEPFKGGDAKNHTLTLGKNTMIAGFESGLVGTQAGDKKTLKLTFPKDYPAAELADQKTEFIVDVHKVESVTLPELNDELATKMGQKTLTELKQTLTEHMTKELTDRVNKQNKQNTFDALLDAHDFAVPKSGVEEEAQHILTDIKQRMKQQNLPEQEVDPALLNEQATKRIKLGLLVNEVVKKNELTVDEDKVKQHIEQIAKAYNEQQAKQVMDWYYGEPSRLAEVRSALLEDEVAEFVLANATVKQVDKKFNEMVG